MDIEREVRLIVFNRDREIGVAVDFVFGLAPVVLGLPVLFGLGQPVAGDSERSEVFRVRDGVLVGLGPDFGELEELFEVGEVLVGDVGFEGLWFEGSVGGEVTEGRHCVLIVDYELLCYKVVK